MGKKIIVLGAGLVGKAIAIDLSRDFDVTSLDVNESAFTELRTHGIQTVRADVSETAELSAQIRPFDLVVGAVPGFLGFKTLQTVIEAGKDVVDISFFPEDPFLLDDLATKKDVTVVTDCGVAPGMGNIILGHHHRQMTVLSYECLVGGLPMVREWPYEYKAVFSPIDVIEEYVRPARFIQNSALVTRDALSDPELVHFEGVGTLESWNSDGLRTLLTTMPDVPDMIEKTLRYPGTIEYLRVLRETGFFSQEEININGKMIRPLDVTARLLFPKWKIKPGEEEFTVMRVRVKGRSDDNEKTFEYNLLDRTEAATGTLSMARTTGYTCTAVVNLVVQGLFKRKGICPPEYLGEHFQYVIDYLAARNVKYTITMSKEQ